MQSSLVKTTSAASLYKADRSPGSPGSPGSSGGAGGPSQSSQTLNDLKNATSAIKGTVSSKDLWLQEKMTMTQDKYIKSNFFQNNKEAITALLRNEKVELTSSIGADILAKVMNCGRLIMHPRRFTNGRWANSARDRTESDQVLHPLQWSKVYMRQTTRYKYHPQQRFKNLMRCFNPKAILVSDMQKYGRHVFYQMVCNVLMPETSHMAPPDLTRLSDLCTVNRSADYLFNDFKFRRSEKVAVQARACYVNGFSRPVRVNDLEDWQSLRDQLIASEVVAQQGTEKIPDEEVLPIAISYKGTDMRIQRRMIICNEDGSPVEGEGLLSYNERIEVTEDFVNDFRWRQVIRTSQEVARIRNVSYVRIWIDRLVMWKKSPEERADIYKVLKWQDFGLFAYFVCPVVRVYDNDEREYGTDFWRKLEAVLGVGGCGLFMDDYILRTFDESLFYDSEAYTRLRNGVCFLGGDSEYLRAVTLSLATALLTDATSTRGAHEDPRTTSAISGWKAWALRTIGEGAYSMEHAPIMREEDAFPVGMSQFRTIAFWESFVCSSVYLEGNSYLDMSIQRSEETRPRLHWDGIIEWMGMLDDSCKVVEEAEIRQFLDSHCEISSWTATTGHTGVILKLRDDSERVGKVEGFGKLRRSLVAELAPFSSSRRGQITKIGEATGLHGRKVLPWWISHVPNPDRDQTAAFNIFDTVVFVHKNMEISICLPVNRKAFLFIFAVIMQWVGAAFLRKQIGGNWAWYLIPGVQTVLLMIQLIFPQLWNWPWEDHNFIGEALFDNLILHSLFKSGIKEQQYRKLEDVTYNDVQWT